MKKLFYIVTIAYSISFNAQTYKVCDSISKKTLAFVNISYENFGFYSDENGDFCLPKNVTDSLCFSHIGYKSCVVNPQRDLKDTIYLSPVSYDLEEVFLRKKNVSFQEFKFLKTPKNFDSWPLSSGFEIITLITPLEISSNATIDEISFMFKKLNKFDLKKDKAFYKNHNAVFRMNIYQMENNGISKKIYISPHKKISGYKKEKISFNISEEDIIITEEGLAIGIEYIGHIDKEGKFSEEKKFIRSKLTDRVNSKYTQSTIIRYVFRKDQKYIPINEAINNNGDRNLSISFTLSK